MARARKTPVKPTGIRKLATLPGKTLKWGVRLILICALAMFTLIVAYAFLPPPTTAYMLGESWRSGPTRQDWRDFEDISPHMPRAIVAAEDANFCLHWGFDMAAIRSALADGRGRGASTISQQTVKNVFLWHGRNWIRKALEALITPVTEAVWSKRRILEVYMNIAEFDEGVFGVGAASHWYFGVEASELTPQQAARLAAILPDPKRRSAKTPSAFVQKRARSIASGAATIRKDGRSACFEG